jgi:hypothetical protein
MESFYAMIKVDRKRIHNLKKYETYFHVQDVLAKQREGNPKSRVTLVLYIYESTIDEHECNQWCVNHMKTRAKIVYQPVSNLLHKYNELREHFI